MSKVEAKMTISENWLKCVLWGRFWMILGWGCKKWRGGGGEEKGGKRREGGEGKEKRRREGGNENEKGYGENWGFVKVCFMGWL